LAHAAVGAKGAALAACATLAETALTRAALLPGAPCARGEGKLAAILAALVILSHAAAAAPQRAPRTLGDGIAGNEHGADKRRKSRGDA
jgi:hypothetical protein